jgi:glucan 1,3-beta-glucosidase
VQRILQSLQAQSQNAKQHSYCSTLLLKARSTSRTAGSGLPITNSIVQTSSKSIYNGRGVLIESEQGPVWLWGTASEHNVLYNYQIANAASVFMAHIQTETPYYQSNPDATVPFTSNPKFNDPVFSGSPTNNKAWGVRVIKSKDVLIYGAGLYSFFENYDQTCVPLNNCQDNMVELVSSTDIHLYGLTTKAAVNQVTVDGRSAALDADNRNNFGAMISVFDVGGTVPAKC